MLLHIEIIMGLIAILPLLISTIIVLFVSLEEWIASIIVGTSIIPLLLATPYALKIEQTVGYYECQKCNNRYIPTYKSVFVAMHIGRTRYMKCPKCLMYSWNKKVISECNKNNWLKIYVYIRHSAMLLLAYFMIWYNKLRGECMDDFENKIKELRQLYAEKPDECMELLDEVIHNASSHKVTYGNLESLNSGVIKEIGGIKLAYILIIAILVLSGFINLGENTIMHFAGLIFFLAGFFIGKGVPVFGLIFLFSHGCTGLGLMLGGVFSNDFYQGILSDMTRGVQIYFTIGIIAIVAAILMMVFYNLSETLRKNDKIPLISLGLFTLSVVMVNLLPYIYSDVVKIFG